MNRTGRRSFTRTLLRPALLLLAGAIINVAVAWALATCVNPYDERTATTHGARICQDGPRVLITNDWSRAGTYIFTADLGDDPPLEPGFFPEPEYVKELLPSWSGFRSPTCGHGEQPPFYEHRLGEARGWPALSMWHLREHFIDRGSIVSQGGMALPLPKWKYPSGQHGTTMHSPRRLPYWIIPVGFTFNTIFYAGIVWLLFTAPGFVRRRSRIMRHRCPACGYLIGTSPVCTECGVKLPSPSR